MESELLILQVERRPQSRIRVLQVIPGEPDGHAMIFARRQVESLEREDVDSRVFNLRSRTSPTILLREYRRLRRAIATFDPDLVHAHFGTMTAFLCAIATRVPLVVTFRGSDLNPVRSISRARSVLGRVLSNLAALRATAIVCVSEQLRKRLWWKRASAIVIPSGVDLEKFRPMTRESARALLGWSPDESVVLFNAGKEPMVKRIDLAEAAVKEARRRVGDFRLCVLRGEVEPDLMPLFLNASDCVLFTSDWEGSPNIIKEAMACDVPIVSVDVGDVRERLSDVSSCSVVAGDPEQLGAAVARLLMSNGRSNGRERVLALSEPSIARRISAVYRQVIRHRPIVRPASAAAQR